MPPGALPNPEFNTVKLDGYGSTGDASLMKVSVSGRPTARSLDSRFGEEVKALDWGVPWDGVTDATVALGAFFEYVNGLTSRCLVRLPAGDCRITGQVKPPRGKCTVRGMGIDSTRIICDTVDGTAKNFLYTGNSPIGGTYGSDMAFEDFEVLGDWGTWQNNVGAFPLLIYGVDRLRFQRIRVRGSRVMGITARNCRYVSAIACEVLECARDGISFQDCEEIEVCNCTIDHIDDDAITAHTSANLSWSVRKGVVITGNRIADAQGIKCIGVRRCVISGNQIERCKQQGISVDVIAGGTTPNPYSVTISGNNISDIFDRSTIDGLNTGGNYITLQITESAGSLAALPGHFDGTGTLVPLYGNMDGYKAGDPLAPTHWINITGNTLTKTLPVGVLYSSYGYGSMYQRSGYMDFTVTDAMLNGGPVHGLFISGGMRKCRIGENIINGVQQMINFGGTTNDFEEILICNNIFNDFAAQAIDFGTGITSASTIVIENNLFDGDPYHISTNRGAQGTWLANTNPCGVLIQNASGIHGQGNTFKRVARVSDRTDVGGSDKVSWLWNVIEADFTAADFNVANRGVGNCPASGQRFIYKIVDNDPASATYNQVLNNCYADANAMPSAGKYMKGHYVRNNSPVALGAGAHVMGWSRLTVGSAHVLGTDWVQCVTLGDVDSPQFTTKTTIATASAGTTPQLTIQHSDTPAAQRTIGTIAFSDYNVAGTFKNFLNLVGASTDAGVGTEAAKFTVTGQVAGVGGQLFLGVGPQSMDFGGSAPASGTWQRGSIRWNSAAAVGQPNGWRCTVTGTPGTWVAMSNL